MVDEIDSIDGSKLLNSNLEELCNYFEEKYKICDLLIVEDQITTEQNEIQIDISQNEDFMRFNGRTGPYYVKGTAISYYIPFEGDNDLFNFRPSRYYMGSLVGTVGSREIILTYVRRDHNAEAVKSEFSRDLDEIRHYLEWISVDISGYNSSILKGANDRIASRREKLLRDHGMVASLGFPLRRRENIPQTYSVPTARKKIPLPKLPESKTPFAPEPTLDMQNYEQILSIISSMVTVIEQSPRAFRDMGEEDLRQHFLVQLNGQYQGQATGETFNLSGKTDILIRDNGKNIFIAECKFWKGPDSLRKALDQLLSYATWRDTKLALIVFNRDRDLSIVLQKIPEVIKAFPKYKKFLSQPSETEFRFILHHPDDVDRELYLTILVFEVPKDK
jgi:hypothetical protein